MSVLEVLEKGVKEKAFPGAVCAFGDAKQMKTVATGHLTYDKSSPQADEETVYDLASLTKVIATTTMSKTLVSEKIKLEDQVGKFLPDVGAPEVTIKELLTHCSGLAAYDWTLTKEETETDKTRARLLAHKKGPVLETRTVYSCLNFVYMMNVIEKVTGKPLNELFSSWVKERKIQGYISYLPSQKYTIAPTSVLEDWRKPVLESRKDKNCSDTYVCGVVHDPIAYLMGGVSGNAGLFGNLKAVSSFAQTVLKREAPYDHDFDLWTSPASSESSRALGWDTKSAEGSSAGNLFSMKSFGHTGFTGTSLWIDKERDIFCVLLSNRVHPSDENLKIATYRPLVHDAVINEL